MIFLVQKKVWSMQHEIWSVWKHFQGQIKIFLLLILMSIFIHLNVQLLLLLQLTWAFSIFYGLNCLLSAVERMNQITNCITFALEVLYRNKNDSNADILIKNFVAIDFFMKSKLSIEKKKSVKMRWKKNLSKSSK